MEKSNLNNKIVNATKWSAIAEVIGKLVAPISNMVLARLLTPEAFGVVATLSMIIAFVEMFTDAGFQKYIIQQPFADKDEMDKDATVAFWTNFVLSIILWGCIAIYADGLAFLVGNPGLGNVLIVACSSLPISAISSIQMAILKKELDFKSLFFRRLIATLVPIFVTIPLAFYLRNYWALVIGTIAVNIANAIVLTMRSGWNPHFYYSFGRLRKMMNFCFWALIDSILIWGTAYIDVFCVGYVLNQYYLGLYKTSMITVGHITSLVVATIMPIVMPAIAKVRDNKSEMRRLLLSFQKVTSIVLLPIGFFIFIFSDLVTSILLGDQWIEASGFIGIWGLMEVVTVLFSRFCSNIYSAIGRPRIAVVAQFLHLIVLIPAVIIAVRYDFTTLYWTRSLVRLEAIFVNMSFAYFLIKLSPWKMILNVMPEFIGCIAMSFFAFALLHFNHSIFHSFLWAFLAGIVYMIVVFMFPSDRSLLFLILKKAKSWIRF